MKTPTEDDDSKAQERARHAQYMREYTARNRDKINAQRRARRTDQTREREKAWSEANRESRLAYRREWRERTISDPERKERHRQNQRRHAERTRDEKNAKARAAYHSDVEASREYDRQKRKANPAAYREIARRCKLARRSRKQGAVVRKVDYESVMARDGWTCGICGGPIDPSAKYPDVTSLSFDHIIPLACGGPHSTDNLQPAHYQCNRAKGHRA